VGRRVRRRGVLTIDTNEPAAPSEAPDAPPPERKSVTFTLPSGTVVFGAVVALVIAALIATTAYESIHAHHLAKQKSALSLDLLRAQATDGTRSTSTDLDSAIAAATSYATAFASYNYQHLSQDFAATEAHATEPFLTQYKRETAGIQPDLVRLKSISTGKVLSAGAVSVTPTNAVVDIFLNQTIVNSARTKPTVEPQRMQMALSRTSATSPWLITKVTLISQ
jgi:hypothetical protein